MEIIMDHDLINELKRLRNERQKKFDEENWEGALEIHDRILELSPSALRYANRGSILYRLGRLEEAVESYRKALEKEPTLKRARADLERLEAQLQAQGAVLARLWHWNLAEEEPALLPLHAGRIASMRLRQPS
jgi:tetratricopeptide (TPR) repeat protein